MASSGVFGDFPALKRWQKQIATAPKVLAIIADNMAEEALTLIGDTFQKEADTYGKAWKALKTRKGKILQDTGRLRSSWHRKRVDMSGFTISAGVKYAVFHQDGTKNIVPRRMVPNKELPPLWKQAFEDVAEEILTEHFAGR